MTRLGLPVRRYLAAILVAAVGFIAISVVDQHDVFIDAWGLAPGATGARARADVEAGGPEERAVREFVTALEAAYRIGRVDPVEGVPVSPLVRQEIAGELSNPVTRAASAGLTLRRLEVLRIESRPPGGWEVSTDETWMAPGGARSRLRFRYRLGRDGDVLRVNEMATVMPEPVSERR